MLQGYNGEKKIFDKRGAFIMNYQECRAYIDDSAKYGSVLGLDNMREKMCIRDRNRRVWRRKIKTGILQIWGLYRSL